MGSVSQLGHLEHRSVNINVNGTTQPSQFAGKTGAQERPSSWQQLLCMNCVWLAAWGGWAPKLLLKS
jgi:hypothetical protein